MTHVIQWAAPSPIWPDGRLLTDVTARRTELRRPALLRFTTDDFMDQFNSMLATEPASLATRRATPEQWWKPKPSPPPPVAPPPLPPRARETKLMKLRRAARAARPSTPPAPQTSDLPLKLFQPVHQRYYLVTGSLVCRRPGMPDHRIDTGRQERVSFVLRRLIRPDRSAAGTINPALADEYALVNDVSGVRWRKVISGARQAAALLVPGEEQLALFPASFTDEGGAGRRLYSAVIPVARRDALMAVPSEPQLLGADGTSFDRPPEARLTLLRSQVLDPWRSVRKLAADTEARIARGEIESARPRIEAGERPVIAAEITRLRTETRAQIQLVSWYTLLDFADFLRGYLPRIWEAIADGMLRADLDTPELNVLSLLDGISYSTGSSSRTLTTALAGIVDHRGRLESETIPYDEAANNWAVPRFPLALLRPGAGETLTAYTIDTDTVPGNLDLRAIEQAIVAVLPPEAPAGTPPPMLPDRPALGGEEPSYVIRFVYERPSCGPVHPPEVSDPTEPFQLAGFFDSDAPARPIRIGLPIDTSPAGLRKFNKNTAFLMSDILCGQVSRMRKLTFMDLVLSVLPWPFHKDLPGAEAGPCGSDGPSFGLFCSLSIPIITICALLVLIIMVTLLDIIFKWLPYFIFCFPIPGFKAKKELAP